MRIIWNYLKNQTKKNCRRKRKKTKKLYDDAGMVKPTFVSKLRQYVNIFSQFTIFSGKNNQNPKDFIKNNFFFKLRRNYAGDKKFSLSLRKLDGTPAKFFSNQDLTQLSTLNHIFLDIGSSPAFDDFVIKYSPKKIFSDSDC